ncbi:hypothetical protein DTO166G4_7112 [Paecilomyces variotii]|nr:hypothetical protein DTO166G4_7112 [Paecilomyces variotii]KAJ9241854.1 hypothetical protein DTO166G5_930 [Paecilomyces variotii]KAJ9303728.1 hypothetical protein DTO217A2_6740 [Paecilomyces variotii]
MESESQEELEEGEALKANEEDAEPISDDEEVEESEDLERNLEPEGSHQVETILVEGDQFLMHSPTNNVEEDEEQDEEGEEAPEDETDLLPTPITQLGDRSQKRSSGRATMPSSRLRGYELY